MVYVFGREEVRMAECVEAFRQLFPDPEARVLVLYDTVYSHCMGECEVASFPLAMSTPTAWVSVR